MNKEQFLKVVELLKEVSYNSLMYNNLGIDLYGGEHSPLEPAHKVIDILLASIYEPVGIDWFNWFCYENDFGEEHLGAFENDGKTLICQTAEELYDYIEQYKIKCN